MTSNHWHQANRILCIRPDYLGDLLMSTPAIRALRQTFAGSSISLLTSASGAAAARFVPEIDDIIEYAAPGVKIGESHAPQTDLDMISYLARREFDPAFIFPVYSQNPLPAA